MISGMMVAMFSPGIESAVQYIENEAQRRIATGDDAQTAYRGAMAEMVEAYKEYKAKKAAEEEAYCPPGEAKDGRLTLTVGVLLERPRGNRIKKLRRRHLLDGVLHNVVYVVKDGDAVLYVGCTRFDPSGRLSEHVAGRTALGTAIRETRPRSNEWSVDLISHPNHKAALQTEMELTVQYKPKYCAAYMNGD